MPHRKKPVRKMVRPRYRDELRAVLDSMQEGVIAVDGSGRVTHANSGAGLLLGTAVERAVGALLSDLLDLTSVLDAVKRVLAGAQGEVVVVRRGQGRHAEVIRVRTAPLRSRRNALAGAIVVMHDASEAERLALVRQEFISNASHELKTPVTAILAMIETLVDASPESPVDAATQTRYMLRIRDQADRLRLVIGDLLALSRLESVEARPRLKRVDLAVPVREAFDALATVAEGRDLQLHGTWPVDPVWVDADHEALHQAASNLIDNAIKYTTPPGRIDVRVRQLKQAGVMVARLEVKDTGIGIPADEQERVFERFYRVDRARSRDAGGTGLGLSIVKHVVRATHGTVHLTSAPGQGSRFELTWPSSASKAPR